jgi:ADP-ribose pyrophosphatase
VTVHSARLFGSPGDRVPGATLTSIDAARHFIEIADEYHSGAPLDEVIVEIPAGKLDSPDEDLRTAALRELREETGILPRELIDLGEYYGSPAILGERIRMFLARGLSFGAQDLDADEFLELFTLPLEKAVEMVMANEIPDGKTQLAILKTKAYIEKEGKTL